MPQSWRKGGISISKSVIQEEKEEVEDRVSEREMATQYNKASKLMFASLDSFNNLDKVNQSHRRYRD